MEEAEWYVKDLFGLKTAGPSIDIIGPFIILRLLQSLSDAGYFLCFHPIETTFGDAIPIDQYTPRILTIVVGTELAQ
jgi:hypothetical protein